MCVVFCCCFLQGGVGGGGGVKSIWTLAGNDFKARS